MFSAPRTSSHRILRFAIYTYTKSGDILVYIATESGDVYGVAMISRLLKIIGLFCKRAL